jgi:hypothetical protein
VGPQHLASTPVPAVQRYFAAQDLARAQNVPGHARISENMKIVVEGPQTVYASDDKIRQANAVLAKGSKIVLAAGEKKDYDMATPADLQGFQSISFADYYQVVPRYNPEVESSGTDLPRQHSPETGESQETIQEKHVAYAKELTALQKDYLGLLKEVALGAESSKHAEKGGVAAVQPDAWMLAANQWCNADPLRKQVLKLGLNEIAAAYTEHKSLKLRAAALEKLGESLEVFLQIELSEPDRIALPTDCGAAVAYVVTDGKTAQDDTLAANPDIGSNYYTALPKNSANVGWNYHWAGVILKDGGDNVTLESAGGLLLGSMGKGSWWMSMYGTQNVDQTFKKRLHEMHLRRNRQALAQLDETQDVKKAKEELADQQKKVSGWTSLTGDQE